MQRRRSTSLVQTTAGALVMALALAVAPVPAQEAGAGKTYTMKITLPTINDPAHFFAKTYAEAVEKDSGGRIKTEIYTASQLGTIPRQIEGTQFGAIQCAIIPPEFFVGVDERFEVMAAPGLIDSVEHGHRLAADPTVLKTMLALGANKGLHGVAMFLNAPSSVISRTPLRHLADFKGRKIRVLASQFQIKAMERLGATPVAMTLGDVIPALQQGAVDGAIGGIVVWTPMHFQDAAKYVTETGQPAVYVMAEINKAWYDALPADLKAVIDKDAAAAQAAVAPVGADIVAKARQGWLDAGGELISLPAPEQAQMMAEISAAAAEVAKAKPAVYDAYLAVTEAAKRMQ